MPDLVHASFLFLLKGKIMKIPGTCCDTCEEPDCKDITAKVQSIKVGDCKLQEEVDIHYCQVKL